EVGDDAARIGEAFDEDRLALRRHRALEVLRVVGIDEDDVPAELLEAAAELRDRSAVELRRSEELVAGLHEGEEGEHLRGMARCAGDGAAPARQFGDALLEHRDGRVGEARVDVAVGLKVEERGGVIDVVEDVGRRLIDRRHARAGGGIGRRAGVDRARLETRCLLVRHTSQPFFSRLEEKPPPETPGQPPAPAARLEDMIPELMPLQESSPWRRDHSILGQRFMTTLRPAASARAAASSLRTPSCIHTTLAPIEIASSTIGPAAAEFRKMSTMSTFSGISLRRA